MSKLLIALFVAAGLSVAGCATQSEAPVAAAKPIAPVAPTTTTTKDAMAPAAPITTTTKDAMAPAAPITITKDAYDVAIKNADAQYKTDKDACSPRNGNAKDICLAEANGKEKVAKADAEAAYKNTPKAREDARDTRAEATFNVAKQKCDALAGNPKDVCVKEADAALVKAKADAKIDRVTADTRQDAATKQADALKKVNADKHDADYKVAIEKCDALAAPAKDACISNAKIQYGKS